MLTKSFKIPAAAVEALCKDYALVVTQITQHARGQLPNGPITIAIRARYEHDSSTIRARFDYNTLQHATRFFCALAYEIDSSTPRESVVGVSCMLIDTSMHTIFTLYLYRPTLHRVCEYARHCLYKRN